MQFRTENDILLEMIRYCISRGLFGIADEDIDQILQGKYNENQFILDLAAHSYIYAQLEQNQKEILEAVNLDSANGENLDRLGEIFNIQRGQAQSARVECNITLNIPLAEDITIPAGTEVNLADAISARNITYVTSEEYIIHAGVTSATITAENTEKGFSKAIPIGSVESITGYPDIVITNETEGTNGKNIEDDVYYRERIRNWTTQIQKGSKSNFDNFLINFEGLDDYKLIPQYDGVGTLKIICDTTPSLLGEIQEKVQEELMLITDYPVVCELPSSTTIQNLTLNITLTDDPTALTEDEIKQLVLQQTETFVDGGTTRTGRIRQSLRIGEDFIPSQLLAYLLREIPEVKHITSSITSIVSVNDNSVLELDGVVVNVV